MLSYLTKRPTNDDDIEYKVAEKAKDKMNSFLENIDLKGGLIAINPKAGDDWKCWTPNEVVRFAKLAADDGKKIVLTGILKDGTDCIEIMNNEFGAENYINLVGKTSIPELGALYERCQAVVSVDTGSMHMSCAVGTPTLALFFREHFSYWSPLNSKKNPYLYDPQGLSAELVYSEVKKIVSHNYQTV